MVDEANAEILSGGEAPDTFMFEDMEKPVTLNQIAGIGLFDLDETRPFFFANGNFQWKLLDATMSKQDRKVSKDSDEKKSYPAFQMKIECVQVYSITDKDRQNDAADHVGKVFTHSWVFKRSKDVGYVVSFANDAGMKGLSQETGLEAIFKDLASKGFTFNCGMRVRPDPNDTDRKFINLDVVDEYNAGTVKPTQG